ncbi:MAG: DEAD/DEAH box helicase, partial [Acidiferrobacteraceae bacterium]
MAFSLKRYQEHTLATLQAYLDAARIEGPARAFARTATGPEGRIPTYHPIEGLDAIPYVCLRLPTGGGKTLIAARAIAIAGARYLDQDFPVTLWLVPSNTIRHQTLDALKNPSHPYRIALDEAFDGRVSVFDIGDVEHIRPTDLRDRACVIVGTLATLRVSDTDGRKIYAHHENFEPHFAGVPPHTPDLERIEEGPDAGKIKLSFANLLHRYRPLVLMDEAHNARTPLTFEALRRVRPACIIEFTATPDTHAETGSNVLCWVSASELKAENMIKLPILLTEHADWQEAVHDAVVRRAALANEAADETALIRPLVLFQAEAQNRAVTVEVLKQHLIEHEGIAPEAIAVATGNQREIDGIDLFDAACPIEHIITVQALKEGWDCSFAYVFCSVAQVHSSKDVEQLLGRVLRMPYVERRRAETLNRAYAHVFSPSFAQAANALRDSLVSMGFDAGEAQAYLQPEQNDWVPPGDLPLFSQGAPLTLTLSVAPDLSVLSPEESQAIDIRALESGGVDLTFSGPVTPKVQDLLQATVPAREWPEVARKLEAYRRQEAHSGAPSERGAAFELPRLCVWVQGTLELAERELFLDAGGWSILRFPAELPELHFNDSARTFEFDIQGTQLIWALVDSPQTDWVQAPGTDSDLVRWLDGQLRQPDVPQNELLAFVRRVLEHLLKDRTFDLATLFRGKFVLAKVLEEKIRTYRQQAYQSGYQETLFGQNAAVETSF